MQPTKNQTNEPHGKTFLSWSFPEFIQYERGKSWYFWTGLIMAGLLVYCFFTYNLLFAIIIVMIAIILYLQSRRKPQNILFKITEAGLEVGSTSYEYKNLKSFWIVYEPPEVKNLYFAAKSSFRPAIKIPLEKQNPLKVRKILLEFLDEDLTQDEESFADLFSRRFKI